MQVYAVGSRIYKLGANSFRYLSPPRMDAIVSAYNTPEFTVQLDLHTVPESVYNHELWSNFVTAAKAMQSQVGFGSAIEYIFRQDPENENVTYTLQLWASEQDFNTAQTTHSTVYNNLWTARDALFTNLGLGIEIKKSVIEIDPTTINESGVPELRAIFDSMA
jgi:hypothetical protein